MPSGQTVKGIAAHKIHPLGMGVLGAQQAHGIHRVVGAGAFNIHRAEFKSRVVANGSQHVVVDSGARPCCTYLQWTSSWTLMETAGSVVQE